MFKINYDYFDNPVVPDYVLTKANKERIGIVKCTEKNITTKFNDLDEINFTTYLYIDGEKNPVYDAVEEMKYILLPNIGFFSISSVTINSEGTELESKTVNAKSYECLLAQKYLENFVINMGTVESIDSVQFYNLADKDKSLLHLVLEKCPDWNIGHLDVGLETMQRSFEVTRQDVYSFLMKDVATAFECVFIFDTLTNTIAVYKEENVGEDTNISISYNNLLKSTNISSNIDNIKTCLTLTGSDDLNIREVNMGFDGIYNFEYFNSIEFMSQNLYNSYNKWKDLRNSKLDEYTSLLSQYQNYYSQINYLTNEKMPDVEGSTNWTEYGLVPLQEQLSAYEQRQSVMMKSGWGDSSSTYYASHYLPVYNTIQDIQSQISTVKTELDNLKSEQEIYYNQMFDIINLVAMENNFTENELKELSTFIREDELSSDNYIVTDTMSDEERFAMLDDFLAFGEIELAKVAVPQMSFSADMANIFAIPEFKVFNGYFDVGNYLYVTMRDDYKIKTRLLTMTYDFYNKDNFSVTFGNFVKTSKNIFSDITEAISLAKSVSTSVSFNQSNWNQASKDTDNIGKMLEDGLLAQGGYISSGDDSEMLIDNRGIFVNTTSGDYANKDSIFIGGGRILFTDDGWKTVRMSVGRANVKGESRFGTFADFCIASYIAGSTIEGGTITGTEFNNGNGTFKVDANGKVTASSGTIGGWTLATTALTNGLPYTGGKDTNATGMGTYGSNWAFWAGNGRFSVNQAGHLYAETGVIGGAEIGSSYIKATNGNWALYNNGTASFGDVYIAGVRVGSSFGGVSIGANGGTYGGFTNGFGANTSFAVAGGALNDFNNLVVNRIDANYINTHVLNAGFVTADTVAANYATIASLNATNANIESLRSASISCSRLTAGTVNGLSVGWARISYVSEVYSEPVAVTMADGSIGYVYSNTGRDTINMYVLGGFINQ